MWGGLGDGVGGASLCDISMGTCYSNTCHLETLCLQNVFCRAICVSPLHRATCRAGQVLKSGRVGLKKELFAVSHGAFPCWAGSHQKKAPTILKKVAPPPPPPFPLPGLDVR